jgi:uncharacterized protein YqgC (DUF456 family)
MDVFLLILACVFLIAGILGSFLPVLPGPPLSWLGLLVANFTSYIHFSTTFLVITALITLLLTIFDYILPGMAVKKRGGTKAGERGAFAGAVIGVFLGPLGIVIGPFAGALAGELMAGNGNFERAFKIAMSSFIGFLLSTGLKLIWCLMMVYWFVKQWFY